MSKTIELRTHESKKKIYSSGRMIPGSNKKIGTRQNFVSVKCNIG